MATVRLLRRISLPILISLTAGAVHSVSTTTFQLPTIADATVTRPGGGTFDRFSFRHGFDARGDRTAFVHVETARGARPEIFAIYLVEGGKATKLAETGDLLPGASELLVEFRQPQILDSGVAFISRDTAGTEAIYLARNGTVETFMDEVLGEPLFRFSLLSEGNRLAIVNRTSKSSTSIYLVDSGSASLVARTGGAAPGGGSFTDFGRVRLSEDLLAFYAETTIGEGIFALLGSGPRAGVRVLVDQDTSLPGLGRSYVKPTAFLGIVQGFDVRGSSVAFIQNGLTQAPRPECYGGVWVWEAGKIREVASNRDLDPGFGTTLKCFYEVHFFESEPWFRAVPITINSAPGFSQPHFGGYLRRSGSGLQRILGRGDKVNGTDLYFYRPVLASRNRVVLYVADGPTIRNSGLYELDFLNAGLTIPTLSTISLFVFTALLLVVAVRKL